MRHPHPHSPAASRRRSRRQRGAAHTAAGKPLTPRQITATSAAFYHVPFWLLWGIAGAESTWGAGGSNLFGLLAAAEGADTADWKSASMQAAKTLHGLKRQYGSWSAAVSHYSGGSYTLDHPKQLAASKGVTPRNSAAVQRREVEATAVNAGFDPEQVLKDLSPLYRLFHGEPPLPDFKLPFSGAPSIPGVTEPGGSSLNPGSIAGNAFNFPGEVLQASNAFTALASTLLDVHFWIRAGEAIAALILLYMGLHALTGQGPSTGTVKRFAEGAAFKRLPPRQRVSA